MDASNLISLLACPSCGEQLESLDSCYECGVAFDRQNGVPSLMPDDVSKSVVVPFRSHRSVMGAEFRKSFRYPPATGAASRGAPYHLDRAHWSVIEQLPAGARVLEIGCGGGQMRTAIRERNLEYLGTDISATRVHEHLRLHGGPDVLCDSHFLPFRDQVFDVVYSAAVTEHLAFPHLVAQEVFRVLKGGGRYLGNVSFMEPWHDDSFFHMSPLGAFELLTQAGFEAEFIWPGKGYSGFTALMTMGNRATSAVSFVGNAIQGLYQSSNYLRRRSGKLRHSTEIDEDARVAGAIDWIARKPTLSS